MLISQIAQILSKLTTLNVIWIYIVVSARQFVSDLRSSMFILNKIKKSGECRSKAKIAQK